MKLLPKILKTWLPVLFWAAVIFIFSSNPDPYRYFPEGWRSFVPLSEVSDSSLAEWIGQVMHFIEYTILAFLLMRALAMTFPPTTNIRKLNLFNNSRSPREYFSRGTAHEVPERNEREQLTKSPSKAIGNSLSFLTIVLAMVFALSDEIHQIFVPGRAF